MFAGAQAEVLHTMLDPQTWLSLVFRATEGTLHWLRQASTERCSSRRREWADPAPRAHTALHRTSLESRRRRVPVHRRRAGGRAVLRVRCGMTSCSTRPSICRSMAQPSGRSPDRNYARPGLKSRECHAPARAARERGSRHCSRSSSRRLHRIREVARLLCAARRSRDRRHERALAHADGWARVERRGAADAKPDSFRMRRKFRELREHQKPGGCA